MKERKVYNDVKVPRGSAFCLCENCGERFGANSGKCARYCKFCRTKTQRDVIDEENDKINEN